MLSNKWKLLELIFFFIKEIFLQGKSLKFVLNSAGFVKFKASRSKLGFRFVN